MNNRDKQILDNTGLVYSIMKSFSYTIDDEDDVFSEGMIGLINAVDKFDPSYEVKFSTFAYKYIRGYILEFFKTKTFDDSLDEPLYNREGEETMTKLDTYSSTDNIQQSYEDDDLFNYRMGIVDTVLSTVPEQHAVAYRLIMSGLSYIDVGEEMKLQPYKVKQFVSLVDRILNQYIFQRGLQYV